MASIRDLDRGMSNIGKLVKQMQTTKIKVGIFSDATNSNDSSTEYVADYAIANEYGSGDIPERSFLRSTIDEEGERWTKDLADAFMEIAKNGVVKEKELYKIGEQVRSDIVAKIDSDISPENAPSTKKKKGPTKTKTLIDTGALRSSVEARIESK